MREESYWPVISAFSKARVLVVGDVMLDRYIYGKAERISPEGPVPVLSVERETAMPGGAANVARNIASLGGTAVLMGVVGTDDDGGRLGAILAAMSGVENRIMPVDGRPTTVKTRYIADNQQLVRVDREICTPLGTHAEAFLDRVCQVMADVDIIVLSDYAKGVLSAQVVRGIVARAHMLGKPTIVDPKSTDVARYDGASVITPNLREAMQMTGLSGRDDASVEAMATEILAKGPGIGAVVITRGGDGMTVADRKGGKHLAVTAREVADISGAGDTVVATLCLTVAAGGTLFEAVELANVAAGIVVGKKGTADVLGAELAQALQTERLGTIVAKTASMAQAAATAAQWRAQGLRVGFTNGCFDLIHPGHISLLEQAKRQCDRLIVGLNTDTSIQRLKGPGRPVQNELSRALVLGALAAVDLVVLFGEDTPLDLITQIRPDVLVKGADYTIATVVGADFVQSYHGRVVLADLMPDQSTTGIITRMDRQNSGVG